MTHRSVDNGRSGPELLGLHRSDSNYVRSQLDALMSSANDVGAPDIRLGDGKSVASELERLASRLVTSNTEAANEETAMQQELEETAQLLRALRLQEEDRNSAQNLLAMARELELTIIFPEPA